MFESPAMQSFGASFTIPLPSSSLLCNYKVDLNVTARVAELRKQRAAAGAGIDNVPRHDPPAASAALSGGAGAPAAAHLPRSRINDGSLLVSGADAGAFLAGHPGGGTGGAGTAPLPPAAGVGGASRALFQPDTPARSNQLGQQMGLPRRPNLKVQTDNLGTNDSSLGTTMPSANAAASPHPAAGAGDRGGPFGHPPGLPSSTRSLYQPGTPGTHHDLAGHGLGHRRPPSHPSSHKELDFFRNNQAGPDSLAPYHPHVRSLAVRVPPSPPVINNSNVHMGNINNHHNHQTVNNYHYPSTPGAEGASRPKLDSDEINRVAEIAAEKTAKETARCLEPRFQGLESTADRLVHGQADLRDGQTLLGQGVHSLRKTQTSMKRDQQLDRQLQEKRHQDMLKDQVGAKYDRLHLKQVQDATLENAKCANANSEIAVTQNAGLIMSQQRSAADTAAALYTGTDAKVPTGAAASHPLGDLTDTWQPGHTGTTLAPPQDTGRSGLLQQDEGVDDELQEFLRLCLNDENEDEGVAGSSVGVPGPSQHAVSGEEEKKEEDDEALSQDPTAFGGEEEEKQEVDLGGEEEEKEEVDGVAGVEDELRGLSLDGVGRRGVVQGSGVMDLTTTGDEGDDNGAEEGDGGGTEGNSARPVNNRRTGKVFAPERETAMKIDEENRKAKAAAEAAEQDQDAEANATVSDAPPASRTRSQQQRNMTVAGEKVDAAEDDATEDDAEDDAEDDTEDEIENEIENQNENENEIENQNNDRIDLLSYQQLRRACRELGLGGNGTKPELRARLRRAGFRAP